MDSRSTGSGSPEHSDDAAFRDALRGLQSGDFTRLSPLFEEPLGPAGPCAQIVRWHEEGRFADHAKESAEALSCACFLGQIGVAEFLLSRGVDAAGGMGTGMNALHWAADRGQLEAVRLLLRHRVPLETRNMYGGTVLGGTVWSAMHETRPQHVAIIEELLRAGADVREVGFPTGNASVDDVLRRVGAT